MIDIIRKERVFKRLLASIILSIIIIFTVLTIFQYNNLRNIYSEQNEINKRLIGTLINKYPEDEVDIIKAINKNDNKYRELGQKTLQKFGYDTDYNMYRNISFKGHFKALILSNLILFIVLISSLLFILYKFIKYIFNKLLRVNRDIENIINNNYSIEENFEEEGIFNIIYTDLNKLSKSLRLKINNIEKEKESIKELVTDISHQLKTPLASLKLYNTLLIEEELDDEDRIEFLKTNEMSINKLHNLIDSLVNISRLEANMINIKKEYKSIKQTLTKAIKSVKAKSNQKSINIIVEEFCDKNIPHDLKWTEESIFNVLENAVKYSKENTNIQVSVLETINFMRIDIEDNGIGIDKSEFNNIFKRFYRNEEVENIEGAGVGLYLSRKILEQQGGNIIVSSKKGQGSKFSLFLTKV